IEPGNGGIKIGNYTNEINVHSDSSCCVHVKQDQALSCAVGSTCWRQVTQAPSPGHGGRTAMNLGVVRGSCARSTARPSSSRAWGPQCAVGAPTCCKGKGST